MLCDDVTHPPDGSPQLEGFERIRAKVARAQKFVLSPEVTAAADGLTENWKALKAVWGYCRLPYPLCWFEWAPMERPRARDGEIRIPQWQDKPKRVGVLCEAFDREDTRAWKTHMIWSFPEDTKRSDGTTIEHLNASLLACDMDTSGADAGRHTRDEILPRPKIVDLPPEGEFIDTGTRPTLADFGMSYLLKLPPDLLERTLEILVDDWAGEPRFIGAFIGLLNTRNVVDVTRQDNRAWSRKRTKKGLSPKHDYHHVKISETIKRRLGRAKLSFTPGNTKLQFVRGHWKIRKTGIFWWTDHTRGDPSKGTLNKDYRF